MNPEQLDNKIRHTFNGLLMTEPDDPADREEFWLHLGRMCVSRHGELTHERTADGGCEPDRTDANAR